jgi:hypothetical protein
MTIGAVARAESLRLAGRWEEALAALDEMDTAEAWLERVQVLSDEHLFARDRGAEIQQGLDRVAEFAAADGDPALEAFVLSRRGLALHVQFLANPDAGETPEEMSLFERALEIREGLGDRRGAAESFFQIGLSATSNKWRGTSTAPKPPSGSRSSCARRRAGSLASLPRNSRSPARSLSRTARQTRARSRRPLIGCSPTCTTTASAASSPTSSRR